MKTKRKINLSYLLLGAAVTLAVFSLTEWENLVKGSEDASAGKPYKYEQSE